VVYVFEQEGGVSDQPVSIEVWVVFEHLEPFSPTFEEGHVEAALGDCSTAEADGGYGPGGANDSQRSFVDRCRLQPGLVLRGNQQTDQPGAEGDVGPAGSPFATNPASRPCWKVEGRRRSSLDNRLPEASVALVGFVVLRPVGTLALVGEKHRAGLTIYRGRNRFWDSECRYC